MDPHHSSSNSVRRNPYSKPTASASTSSQTHAPSHRRTLQDANSNNENENKNNRQTHQCYSHTSSSSSTNSQSKKRKLHTSITPFSALDLWRSSLQPSLSLHLLSADLPWTRLDAGRIHELAGAAGTAKTQLALQACMDCSRAGYECVYVTVKHVKNLSRLAHRLAQMIPHNDATTTSTDTQHDILSRIHLTGIRNADELAELTIRDSQRLLVLDSVADVFRGDTEYTERALQFCQWVQNWRRDYQHCAMLILNQVTLNDAQPALGMTWAHCVNTSFLVQHHTHRSLSLRRSPVFAKQHVPFTIQTSGCQRVL